MVSENYFKGTFVTIVAISRVTLFAKFVIF